MADRGLRPRAAYLDSAVTLNTGRGIIATDLDGCELATIAVKQRQYAPLAERVRDRFAIELPLGPRLRGANGVTFAGTGPGIWLAIGERNRRDLAASLRKDLGEFASVVDQSDGYAVIRLAGPRVRDTLAKMIPIDVHPLAFNVGDVASTVAFHMSVTLWRLENRPDGEPTFDIAVFRSLASSFWDALSTSAAEFGLAFNRRD